MFIEVTIYCSIIVISRVIDMWCAIGLSNEQGSVWAIVILYGNVKHDARCYNGEWNTVQMRHWSLFLSVCGK